VGARTGLGALDVGVLCAVADLGGEPDADYVRSSRVLGLLEARHGFGPRYAYPLMQDLAAAWRLHLPLLDGGGNWGSARGHPAAEARYTEVRLSPVGALALTREQAKVGPVPLGLIEGSLYREGPIPPFAPNAVLTALTNGDDSPGPPAMPGGGTIDGDLAALLGGNPARLQLGCTVVAEQGDVVITEMPLGVTAGDVYTHLKQRIVTDPDQDPRILPGPPRRPTPIVQVVDRTTARHGIHIVWRTAPGVDGS